MRKWKDTQFCSGQHEIDYHESIQRGMLDRLRVSRERAQRALRSMEIAQRAEQARLVAQVEAARDPMPADFLLADCGAILEQGLRAAGVICAPASIRPALRWPGISQAASPLEVLASALASADQPVPCPA